MQRSLENRYLKPLEVRNKFMILHLHGFRSVGNNAKYTLLKWAFKNESVESPTLPCNPPETISLIEEIMERYIEPTVVIGTSLGGFYAWYAAAVFRVPAVLINPSLKPYETLNNMVGVHKRLETDDVFEWKAEYQPYLKEIHDRIHNSTPPDHYLSFYLSNDDEMIDHSHLPNIFPDARKIEFFDNSGHVFKRFQEIIPDIKEILNELKEGKYGY